MAMTKARIIEAVFKEGVMPRKDAGKAVEKLLTIIKETLVGGEYILISGFGRFQVRRKRTRYGRNPRTGEVLEIKPCRAVYFHISGTLLRKINGEDVGATADEDFYSENQIRAKIGQKADRKWIKIG